MSELCSDTISTYPNPVLIQYVPPRSRSHSVVCFRCSPLRTTFLCRYSGPGPHVLPLFLHSLHNMFCPSLLWTFTFAVTSDPTWTSFGLEHFMFPCHVTSLDMFLVQRRFLIHSLFNVCTMFPLVPYFVSHIHSPVSLLCTLHIQLIVSHFGLQVFLILSTCVLTCVASLVFKYSSCTLEP